jgi:hypothetical protein
MSFVKANPIVSFNKYIFNQNIDYFKALSPPGIRVNTNNAKKAL